MSTDSFVSMDKLAEAARAHVAARLKEVKPGEVVYFAPRIMIGEDHVPVGFILKEMGMEMVDVNYWRKRA
jgi:hypothetical protein